MNAIKKPVLLFICNVLIISYALCGCANTRTGQVAGEVRPNLTSVDTKKAALKTKVVVIDPGHQDVSFPDEMEPIGPGASEMKEKYSNGDVGKYSGLTEAKLCLEVSEKLKTELENRGYTVRLTRSDNQTLLSNKERAEVLNSANADIYIRIHGNYSRKSSDSGADAFIPSSENAYVGYMHGACQKLSQLLLNAYCAETGMQNNGCTEKDNISGNNWSTVPVALIELGYLSNENDDTRMADSDFQVLMAKGLADGVGQYFSSTVKPSDTKTLIEKKALAEECEKENDIILTGIAYEEVISYCEISYINNGILLDGSEECYKAAIRWYLSQNNHQRAEELKTEIVSRSQAPELEAEIAGIESGDLEIAAEDSGYEDLVELLMSATQDSEAVTEPEVPETEVRETKVPETEVPETEVRETEVRETEAPEMPEDDVLNMTEMEPESQVQSEQRDQVITEPETEISQTEPVESQETETPQPEPLPETEVPESEIQPETETSAPESPYAEYQAVINQYQEAMSRDFDELNDSGAFSEYPLVNTITLLHLHNSEEEEMKYVLYDIDGNGTPELLLSEEWHGADRDGHTIMDVYGTNGFEAQKFFYNDTLAERSRLSICEDGTLYIYGSGGAAYGTATFYKIGEDGYTPEVTEEYTADWEMYPDTPYYNDAGEFLTQEQIDGKLAECVEITDFEWIDFDVPVADAG